MKRFLFCCLRGGNCTIDISGRRKCNFCRNYLIYYHISISVRINLVSTSRFEKCRSVGMILNRPKQNAEFTLSLVSTPTPPSGDSAQSYIVKTQGSTNVQIRLYSGLNVLSGEVAKVRFLKQLFSIQCELEPIAACKVIPIMEATRLGRAYDSGLAIFNERVTI